MSRTGIQVVFALLAIMIHPPRVSADIPIPADAPKPMTPAQSRAAVELPDGFRLELVASEPLIRNPSGVCFDERGRMFVCELHGYNLEGQYDIEELNKTGKLDKVVRRIPAPPEAVKRAEREQTGTVKRLIDTDGDGVMDKAEVWADDLPACFGLVAARGGVIVVCSPHIVYLADGDGDGKAEVRQTLFTGFKTGILERRMNAPQWGVDGWVYVGRGQGGTITGPKLSKPVQLPRNDFRFRADGSAIEPVPEGTHTFGFALTESGDRFTVSTGTPAYYIAPMPWRYLARNPAVSFGSLRVNTAPSNRTYPISKPHPWRSRRATDPGFSKFYTSRYGVAESAPNGYFTSACSPFVYQDTAMPGLRGHLLACEPAQNMVHRAVLTRNGLVPRLQRLPRETQREFLASRDIWFHPINLTHAPDGSVVISDFYREIIEDYSAIPRYLQQQYRLNHGERHGRVWRLVHDDMAKSPAADMSALSTKQLVGELASGRYWRRETARRLLTERNDASAAPALSALVTADAPPHAAIGALHVLDALSQLTADALRDALRHNHAAVVTQALRLADTRFKGEPSLIGAAMATAEHDDPRVRIQLGLSLGETTDPRARTVLSYLAVRHAHESWMTVAILSSLRTGGDDVLAKVLSQKVASDQIDHSAKFIERLCAMLTDSRDPDALSNALTALAKAEQPSWQRAGLTGVRGRLKRSADIELTQPAREALMAMARSKDSGTAEAARTLVNAMRVETAAQRKVRLARAAATIADVKRPMAERIAAVRELGEARDHSAASTLLSHINRTPPAVRVAIIDALLTRREYTPHIVKAMEDGVLPVSAVSAVRRAALLEHPNAALRRRAESLFKAVRTVDDATMARYTAALSRKRDIANGGAVFKRLCATCHQAHGEGHAVGPDLDAEFRRTDATFLQDILTPNATVSAGYTTYTVETLDGDLVVGLLHSESPTSVTLKQAEGKRVTLLRKDIASFKATGVSIMPENLVEMLQPMDVADLIGWLRQPASRRVLFDDREDFVDQLVDGKGRASIDWQDKHRGAASLRVTPPQRYSARIAGWSFRMRETPGPGEYRYIRFAWKSAGASGVMIEIANSGAWPPAKKPVFRYYAGANTTGWSAVRVADKAPAKWTVITRDLWKDFGDATVTGIAPTAMGGAALFDAIELLREKPTD